MCTDLLLQVHYLATKPEVRQHPKQCHLTPHTACMRPHTLSADHRMCAGMLQGRDAPTMPGKAPTVLVMPRRKGACRGDRSAWLQYRPHMEKDAIPNAAVTKAAGQAVVSGSTAPNSP